MSENTNKPPSPWLVILAFAIVYIVWGSTYLFIRIGIEDLPPFTMAALRFITAGFLLMLWCLIRKERLFVWKDVKPSVLSGLLMLVIGNGGVVWAEQHVTSSLAAILVSAGPIWFVILDKKQWKENFTSKETIVGLLIGFAGVILLFSENAAKAFSGMGKRVELTATAVLILASVGWAAGSLFSKYRSTGSSSMVNTTWQMLGAGVILMLIGIINGEVTDFDPREVSGRSWFALFYLITLGSLLAYSAYVWLLRVRPAAQVSTHSYVNPVVAVLVGVIFANEKMSGVQLLGLAIILLSVLLVNMAKYRKQNKPA